MWHNTTTGFPSSGDRYPTGGNHRKRDASTKDLAREEVQPPRKKQRIVGTLLSTSSSKRERNISIGNTTTVALPETFSSLDATRDTRQHQPVLPIPHLSDSPNELLSKLIAIADVLRAGRSIAEATAYSAAPTQDRNAEKRAVSQMRLQEQEAWTTFQDGLWHLPEFDWDNNSLPPPTSTKPLKTARRRAEALNRLCETDRAHEGHVVWITKNNMGLLHLVQAMARVIGEERNLVGGCGGWSATQLADLQSINRILSISGQMCQESNVLRSEISDIQRVLGTHRHRLQALSKEAT
ncbi:hypothetical protein BKA61DRAFT_342254 [Leptodontidium sp. MPI-SDFR-AT-0119]|nr:hypothetical protein BKA61DRAFT_342254 [Leptodontidium sp. MPI-SDFR-AT-0119]